jgi:hypothetical protein
MPHKLYAEQVSWKVPTRLSAMRHANSFANCTLAKRSPSAEYRLPKSLHFAESDVIIGVVRERSVHKVGYGHKWDWEA